MSDHSRSSIELFRLGNLASEVERIRFGEVPVDDFSFSGIGIERRINAGKLIQYRHCTFAENTIARSTVTTQLLGMEILIVGVLINDVTGQ